MVGELYAIHGDQADRDGSRLGSVLQSWAAARPVGPGGSMASATTLLATKIRRSASELIGSQSRGAILASRGRTGTDAVLRTGTRMHRRMRLHPSLWARPASQSTGAFVLDTVGKVAAERLTGRVPQALLSAARDRTFASMSPAQSDEPPGTLTTSGPHEALTVAWALHQRAGAASSDTSDPIGTRLTAALTAQERHLQLLSRRLGEPKPHVPNHPRGENSGGDGFGDAARLLWQAEDAIDAVEETGAQSRRLQAWSTRRRAGLVYLITALIVSAIPFIILLNSAGLGLVGILLAQCLAVPWLSLAAGAVAIGPSFRPWLGGPVPRHPLIGSWIVLGVHVGLGVLAAAISVLT
jgi:hypothetical protein